MVKYDEFSELEKYAKCNNVPIIEKEGLKIIIDIIKKNKIKSMLEIGSAIGYSALNFNYYTGVVIDTIERDEEMFNLAKKNIEKYGENNSIVIYNEDALAIDIDKLKKYDCIYIDAAKAQYKSFLCKFESLLNEKGIILFDNLSFHGYVSTDLKYTKSKSFRQMIDKIENFIDYVTNNPKYDFYLIDEGDGIGVLKMNESYEMKKKLTITYHNYDTIKEIFEKYNEHIKMINIGANQFGVRQQVDASIEEIEKVAKLAHVYDIEVFVMCNKLLHNKELISLEKYLRKLEKIKVDGVVFSDLAVLDMIKRRNIKLRLQYSTETTITNSYFTKFAASNEIESIELAKEITAKEINEIVNKKESQVSVYIFGHLYMYQSVRKMLSNFENIQELNFLSDNDKYLYDDERDSYYPIIENSQGTHILSAKDLCIINKLDKLNLDLIDYLKIDGFRYTSQQYYQIVKLHVQALDSIHRKTYEENKQKLNNEIKNNSDKKYFTGFFFKETLY